jgi:hypothetical protein
MANDLFDGSAPINGKHYDLFSGAYVDSFRWVVGVFSGDGASHAIIKANKSKLQTYYPIRFNQHGEPTPLFRNYLFIQFIERTTINICRETPNFIKILNARDEDGIFRPILVRRNAVDENKAMVMAGRFNERMLVRKFYGRGTIVRILNGVMADKTARLEMDVLPEMRGNVKISIDINGVKCLIELHNLAL